MTFILAVCTKIEDPNHGGAKDGRHTPCDVFADSPPEYNFPQVKNSSYSPPMESNGNGRKQDKFLGKVVLGCKVKGEEERKHWFSVMSAPRKVISEWHALK